MKVFKARQMYLLFIVILSVFSITGCGGGGSDGQAPILGSGNAVIAPRVTLASPLNNATGVALNRNITATFSKEMTLATVTAAGTFTVAKTSDGLPIAGTVTYVAAGSTATFNPTSDLTADTLYRATISVAAKDLAGAPLAAAYTWTFKTGLTLDVTAPTLISTGVADGATDVPINRNSTATFSESMAPATLASPATNFTVVKTLGGASVAGTVTYVGNTATFNPTSDLEPNTQYTSTILAGATDLAGNALVAGTRANPWSWTTAAGAGAADSTAPTVTLTSPVNLATNVDLNKTVSATFSEEMTNSTITTTTFTLAPTATPAALVSGVVIYDPLTNIATFNPNANLTASTNYTATITSGAQDLAGNALVVPAVGGLPKPNPWTFTTGTGLAPGAADLKSVAPFGTFGGSAGMTNQGTLTQINGDIGTIATDTSTVTGFHDVNGDIYTETGSNIGAVNGTIYTCTTSTTGPTSATVNAANCDIATQARLDAVDAYNYLRDLPSDGVLAGNLAGTTINPGVYTNASSVKIEGGDLTLDALGDANAVFVFQIGSTLTVGGPGAAFPQSIILAGGAQAKNVFWQVGTAATINAGGGGTMEGTIIADSGVSFSTVGNVAIVTLNGRALSLVSSVTMTNTVINVPAP
ncbi:MAG: hypothetical protein A2512_06435 [Deltaproteobacteria bacterium RIFOXYD12_FULL_56_24]|nr:MAG: hypothetical protein A2512_06435 [Deltaproteobacteria bacterium RIFOXYD12_FULL_56_24]